MATLLLTQTNLFFLLNNFCFAWFRRVKKECIDTIIGKSYVGDWFLFYLLGQNIDSVIFKVNVKFIRNPLFRHQTHFRFDMRVCEWVCFATSLFQPNKIITKYLQKKSVPKIFNDKIDKIHWTVPDTFCWLIKSNVYWFKTRTYK